jgi:hypothetical protein
MIKTKMASLISTTYVLASLAKWNITDVPISKIMMPVKEK